MNSDGDTTGYTLEQARRISRNPRHRIPGKGQRCPNCDVRVPRLLELTPEQDERLRRCARGGEVEASTNDIAKLTGIAHSWARILARHETDLRSYRCDIRPMSLEEARQLKIEDIWNHSRGKVCRECGNAIPEIVLPQGAIEEIRGRRGYPLSAMWMLRTLGVDATVAKNYALHLEPHPRRPTASCPHCGADLASPRAKQCLECHADWHDPK